MYSTASHAEAAQVAAEVGTVIARPPHMVSRYFSRIQRAAAAHAHHQLRPVCLSGLGRTSNIAGAAVAGKEPDLCIHTALLQAAEHTCLHLGPHGGIRHHQRAPPQQYGVPSQMREDAAALIVSS